MKVPLTSGIMSLKSRPCDINKKTFLLVIIVISSRHMDPFVAGIGVRWCFSRVCLLSLARNRKCLVEKLVGVLRDIALDANTGSTVFTTGP